MRKELVTHALPGLESIAMMYALISTLLAALLFVNPAFGTMVNIQNNYAPEIHIDWDVNRDSGFDPPGHLVIPYGETASQELVTGWAGAFYIGLVPNMVEDGEWRTHDSKVEFSIKTVDEWDHFDMDIEHGMSAPAIIFAGEKSAGCGLDKLATCPPPWTMYDDNNWPVQCRSDLSPEADAYFRQGCEDMYIHHDDHRNKAAAPATIDVKIGVSAEPTVGRRSDTRGQMSRDRS